MPVRWSRLAGQVLGRPSTCTARKGHEEGTRPPAPWDSPVAPCPLGQPRGPLPPGTAPWAPAPWDSPRAERAASGHVLEAEDELPCE